MYILMYRRKKHIYKKTYRDGTQTHTHQGMTMDSGIKVEKELFVFVKSSTTTLLQTVKGVLYCRQ